MLNEKLLKDEVYTISVDDRTLIYAPLTRSFAVCEDAIELSEVDSDWLATASLMDNVPSFIKNQGFVYDMTKIRLRLNITTKCNLKCKYCSVKAGQNVRDMSSKIALESIQSFCSFARGNGAEVLEIVFSGGEPTLNISLIKKCIENARANLLSEIKVKPRILTNGLFSARNLSRILNQVDEFQVSWDGRWENDRFGPDQEIAKKIWRNIEFLSKSDAGISVLVVVSEANFQNIRKIVDELISIGITNIFLALKESLGRARSSQIVLDYSFLGNEYLALWKDCRTLGIDINLTGTDIHSISPFPCSVPIPNYSVSPEGKISACTISFNDSSADAHAFDIGRVSERGAEINPAALDQVREYHVLNIPGCSECYAKWHCRGGCPYAKEGNYFTPLSPERCSMTRKVIARKLLHVISES